MFPLPLLYPKYIAPTKNEIIVKHDKTVGRVDRDDIKQQRTPNNAQEPDGDQRWFVPPLTLTVFE